MRKLECLATAIMISGLLGACSLAPTYEPPTVSVASQYRPAGPWTTAEPADQLPRDGWWKLYGDTRLDQLEEQLLAHNTDLAVALASYQQSRSYLGEIRADLFPQVSLGASATRNRQSDTAPLRNPIAPAEYNSVLLGGQATYEVDLWGRVRDSVAASQARVQASSADLASVRLSLAAQLADSYVTIIGVDRQLDLLQITVAAYERAEKLTRALYSGGAISRLDVDRAKSESSSARAQLLQVRAQRALLEHAIAVLVGQSASTFSLPTEVRLPSLPIIPIGLPSSLLQRRPDIASAERLVATANAQIGVARAAFFPSLTLSAGAGVASSAYSNLISAPNSVWSVGPNLLLEVLDGGRRRAQLNTAHTRLEEAIARYRGTVLTAFRQVEDNQSQLTDIGGALIEQQEAVDAADRALKLSTSLYAKGIVNYLNVITAQTISLQAHLTLQGLQTSQLHASVQLIRALGGGWSEELMRQASN